MGITKERAAKCVTHHHACDCREYKYQEMEQALKIIHTWASVPGCLVEDQVLSLCEEVLQLTSHSKCNHTWVELHGYPDTPVLKCAYCGKIIERL